MSFLFQILADLLFGWLWWLIPDEVDRRRDLKRFTEGEVRCSIRAVNRRVLNIPTEPYNASQPDELRREPFDPAIPFTWKSDGW